MRARRNVTESSSQCVIRGQYGNFSDTEKLSIGTENFSVVYSIYSTLQRSLIISPSDFRVLSNLARDNHFWILLKFPTLMSVRADN